MVWEAGGLSKWLVVKFQVSWQILGVTVTSDNKPTHAIGQLQTKIILISITPSYTRKACIVITKRILIFITTGFIAM